MLKVSSLAIQEAKKELAECNNDLSKLRALKRGGAYVVQGEENSSNSFSKKEVTLIIKPGTSLTRGSVFYIKPASLFDGGTENKLPFSDTLVIDKESVKKLNDSQSSIARSVCQEVD